MNVISLTGNLCRDVKIEYTKNNKSYVENTIGVKKEKKDDDGNYETDFIDFVCFEKKADYLQNYAQKGDKVELVGKLRVDNWKDEKGDAHTRSYVVADKISILTSRVKKEQEDNPF